MLNSSTKTQILLIETIISLLNLYICGSFKNMHQNAGKNCK